MCVMARKHHHMPLFGGDRNALTKELSKSRAMTHSFAERSAEKRLDGQALIREADSLACQSWNERMWSDGGPIDPSPTIDQPSMADSRRDDGIEWRCGAFNRHSEAAVSKARWCIEKHAICVVSENEKNRDDNPFLQYILPRAPGRRLDLPGATIAPNIAKECAMTPAEIDSLVLKLRQHTPLDRLPLHEAKQVFQTLVAWGYVVTAPAAPPAAK